MKLIDADALKRAILTTMPERSEVLLIVDNQPEIERLKAVINHNPDCANAEHDSGGCLGYSGSHDDEPIESCKKCEKYTGNN